MAEAMIEVALQTLSSLLRNQLFSFLGVNREMRRLSSLLTTIKAVLEDAEQKQLTNKALKDWLRKLRDEAHLLDDVLDECSTHALSLEYQDKVLGSCFSSLKPSHVKYRFNIAKELKNISRRLHEIAEERSKFHLSNRVHEERRNGGMEWRETSSNISQPHFYGRDAEKQKIVDFLVNDASHLENLSVYPIVGIGGLGKTTIAQQVYHDERVFDHFDLRLWVCVSDGFSLTRLLKAIIESAGHTCQYSGLEPLQRQVQELLGTKKYLLVLDDVWNDNQEKWDRLRYVLASGSKGSSILVTTRLAKVAHITRTVKPLQLSLLPEDDCWELFKQRAFGPFNEERAELVDIGKEIVKKCKGVPLAAKTLGSLLRFHSDENYWIRIKEDEIWNLPQEEQEEESIMPALRLSYLNLSTISRQCFAYLAVFPKDQWMSKKHVIELWMANGFISTIESRGAEDDGDKVWNELYLKSFLEDVSSNGGGLWGVGGGGYDHDTKFKLHDVVHDLAQFVMEEECCSKKSKSDPPGERTRHMSIYGGGHFGEHWSSHLCTFKSLKSLIILTRSLANISNDILKCSSLRVLDVEALKKVPSSINQLKHLRYLNLSHGRFTTLPHSICRLWNLQTLNLDKCWNLQKLPNKLKCLKSLCHLHLEGCRSLSKLAPEMGKLTCLKTLVTYIVGKKKGLFLEEIGNLKLEGTLRIEHLERVTSVIDAEKSNLVNKRINKLVLSWERNEQSQLQENEEEILEVLQPHTQIKTLHIVGYRGSHLPQWMGSPMLKDLCSLKLRGCRNVVGVSLLGKLPSLKRLWLWKMDKVRYIDDECYVEGVERGFQALELLTLINLSGLVKLSRENGGNMFPRLSTLQIVDLNASEDLSRVLLGSIQNLSNLEILRIYGDRELTSFPDNMLGGLRNLKILHIWGFPKLETLPSGLANSNALHQLEITDCHSLETITEEVLRGLCSLKTFTIDRTPKFKVCAGFRHLIALKHLSISGCLEVEDMHDALQHLTTLNSISLEYLPNLASLPHCLGNLSSLQELNIFNCPKLTSLPMSIQSLTNLKSLTIGKCPELEKSCKDATGEDWHKISHLPHLHIWD